MGGYERFSALWTRIGGGPPDPAWNDLDTRYREPERAYHNGLHIETMLRGLDECRGVAEFSAARFDDVEAAIWFHDVVYDARANDNEERSAELFRHHAATGQIEVQTVEQIVAMILATKTHSPSAELSTRLLLDLDLAVLGASSAEYETYVARVRREYAFVPEPQWRAGRSAVLLRFLERSAIYQSAFYGDRLEAKARRNLATEIEALRD